MHMYVMKPWPEFLRRRSETLKAGVCVGGGGVFEVEGDSLARKRSP